MRKLLLTGLSILIISILTGCSGKVSNMQIANLGEKITLPKKGNAKIVFLRPSTMGYAVQSSVFKIEDNNPKIVGIVAAKKKMSYDLVPGDYIFMVVGESADFMYAEVEANKTYYASITPRMGMWKARFSLEAISTEKYNDDFKKSLEDSELVVPNQSTLQWAQNNQESIQSKYLEYYKKWMSKDVSLRPKLLKSDGI